MRNLEDLVAWFGGGVCCLFFSDSPSVIIIGDIKSPNEAELLGFFISESFAKCTKKMKMSSQTFEGLFLQCFLKQHGLFFFTTV